MTQPIATLAYKHALLAKLERLSRENFDDFEKMRDKYANTSAEQILDYCKSNLKLIDQDEYDAIKSGWMADLRYIIRRFGEALEKVGRHGPELHCVLLQTDGEGPTRVFVEHDAYLVDVVIMVRREVTIMKGATGSEAESLRQIRSAVDGALAKMEQNDMKQSSGY